MLKKYELTTDTKIHLGHKLYRIKALRDFGNVKAGELGGYIEKEENLGHDGNAWVHENAWVCENAEVCGNAVVRGNAWVHENAVVRGNADYLCIKGLGSYSRNTTFYKTKDGGVSVVCGCFNGTLDEFAAKVKNTHKNSKYAREYLAAVEVVKIHFELEDKDNGKRKNI